MLFAPVLALACMRCEKPKALWINALFGLAWDLLSAHFPFGAHTAMYALGTFVLHGLRRRFYPHKLFSLPAYTYLFSLLISGMEMSLLCVREGVGILSWKGIVTSVGAMPLLDALYALVCFALPMTFLRLRKAL